MRQNIICKHLPGVETNDISPAFDISVGRPLRLHYTKNMKTMPSAQIFIRDRNGPVPVLGFGRTPPVGPKPAGRTLRIVQPEPQTLEADKPIRGSSAFETIRKLCCLKA